MSEIVRWQKSCASSTINNSSNYRLYFVRLVDNLHPSEIQENELLRQFMHFCFKIMPTPIRQAEMIYAMNGANSYRIDNRITGKSTSFCPL